MAESNKEKIAMLKTIIDNADKLSYDDIDESIRVAYGIANSDDLSEDEAKELPQVMAKLAELLTKKKEAKIVKKEVKPNNSKKSEETNETSEKNIKTSIKPDDKTASILKAIEEAKTKKKEEKTAEKTIPKPIKEEVTLNNASEEIIEKTISEEDYDKIVESAKRSIDNNTIPKAKKSPENPVPPIPAPEVKTEKEVMEVDTPTVQEQIIVSANSDKKESNDEPKNELDYSFLEDKPFEGDDDISTDDEDLKNITFEDAPSKEAIRIKKISEEFGNLPEGMRAENVKQVTRKKVSDTLKALSRIDASNLDINKIQMFDFSDSDEGIRREYLKTRNDMIANPRISRTSLLMSGHYEEISAFSNFDFTSIERTLMNPDISFVDKEIIMFNSIYNHVKYVSYSTEKPDFDTWAENIRYPDIASLYYGVYDANSVGENHYNFNCPFCGMDISVSRKNRDLTVAIPKELTSEALEKFISSKDIMKTDSIEIAKRAKNSIVRKRLPSSNIIVDYSIPTLLDYLRVLKSAERISQRDFNGALDLSAADIFNAEGKEEDAERILAYLYVSAIGIPAIVNDEKGNPTNKFRYIRLTNKADIIEHINGLDRDDYKELFNGDNVTELMVKSATRYYLENTKCDSCGKNIKYVSLDPKQIFFFKIGEDRQ